MPARRPMTTEEVQAAIHAVAETCPTTAEAIQRVGLPETRAQEAGTHTFLRVICGQQLSVKAAASIWARVDAHFAGDFAPDALLALDVDGWRSLGLSGPKTKYVHGLAQALKNGSFRPKELPDMNDADAVAHITALKGFGAWSAEIYLLFAEGRGDMFPADDLAVQKGYQRLFGLEEKPGPKTLRKLTEDWAPHRGSMAIFLWHYYGAATLDD